MRGLSGATFFFGILAFGLATSALAQSRQPYIDQLKEQMPPEEPRPSVIDSVRRDLPPSSKPSYIDQLKSEMNEEDSAPKQSLIEREKARLQSEKTAGAIDKFKRGESDLELRRPGEIGRAMGIRIGGTLSRNITATNGVGARNYSDIYGQDRVPEINFFYEFQPFHSEWFGSLGFFGSAGIAFDSGKGRFVYTPPNVGGGAAFTAESRTRFYFWYFPVVAGLNYRFNLFRIIRPFVMAGPSLIPYWEARSDSKSGIKGYSRGLFISVGASVLLDFLSDQSAWDLYEAHDVKHYYFTVDYSRMTPMAGDVRFDVSGLSAGLTFEF